MARPGKGILGDFSGKVGTVVGSSWRGIPYMRSLPSRKKNVKLTEAQQLQQAKFALATSFIGAFTPLFETSFQQTAGQTGRNAALANLVTQAIGGVYPNLLIEHSLAMVAKGSLKKADNANADSPAPGKLRFSWTDNTGLGNATANDKAILVAYCPETNDVAFTIEGGIRQTGEFELDVPSFSGKQVHTWISFRSAKGKLTADSVYAGAVTVS
jgi:hypothetical protein